MNTNKLLMIAALAAVGLYAFKKFQATKTVQTTVDALPSGAYSMPPTEMIAGMGSYQTSGCMN